ncbi:MAG TPA: hypothetical protein VEE84_06545 [Burkholderiaceae bacterium]|nr:hypothetical protein [Burkholderiaceae bacterium]
MRATLPARTYCVARTLSLARIAPARAASIQRIGWVLVGLLTACVYVPRTTTVYDDRCKIYARQMRLDVEQVGAFARCANEGCVALLVGMGAVAAASAVVSGSIVVAGNIVYWFEKQGQCSRQ